MVAGATYGGLEGFDRVALALGKTNGREKKGVLCFLSGADVYGPTMFFMS